jgi:hypothetical protein
MIARTELPHTGWSLLRMSKVRVIEKKSVSIEPIPTDWGDVHITAHITTAGKSSTVTWEIDYPAAMPQSDKDELDAVIKNFMDRQYEDLVRLFG